jgi:hypothetical protein
MVGQTSIFGREDVNFQGTQFKNSVLSIARSVSFLKIPWMRVSFICLPPNLGTPFPLCLDGSFSI